MSDSLTPPKPKGRHRAAPPPSDPANFSPIDQFVTTQQLPVVVPELTRKELREREREATEARRHRHRTSALATGSMLAITVAGGVTGVQNLTQQRSSDSRSASQRPLVAASAQEAIMAATDAPIVFDRPKVGTVAAPPPPVKVQAPATGPAVRVEQAAPAPAAPVAAPKPVAAVAAAPVTSKAAAIAAAALSQIGVYQDCTMLVTNSLKTVGISFHDWPIGYLKLGRQVTMAEAVPGDLLYYVNGSSTSVAGLAHIAVYIGNGKAVHGGFNGNETVIWSVNVGNGIPPTAIVRVS